MTSEEKRFFKIYAQKYDKENDNLCLALFNAVNTDLRKGTAVNDDVVRLRIKGLKLESYFISAKNKLKNMLFDALFEMHGRHNEDYAIIKDMGIAGILHDKGFEQECNKQLQQAMDTAHQKEYYTLWLEGYGHRLNYNTDINDFGILQQWNKERSEVINVLEDYTQQQVYNRLFFSAYLSPDDKIDAKTKKIFQERALEENIAATKSAYAKYLALNGLVFYLYKNREVEKANAVALQQKEVLEQTLAITSRYVGEFFIAYQNYLNSLQPDIHADLIIEGSRDMENRAKQYITKSRTKRLSYVVISNAVIMRLNTYIDRNNKSELPIELSAGIKIYKQTSEHMAIANKVALLAVIKDGWFVLGKYTEALKWIKELKQTAPAGIFNKYKLCNLITELLILIDNKASVKSIRNSEENIRLAIARYEYTPTQQQGLLNLLKLISQVPTARNKSELQKSFAALSTFVLSVKNGNESILRNLFAESNVLLWVNRNIQAAK